MNVPASEVPDVTKIRHWAEQNLPAYYRLLDVRCGYGTPLPTILPEDFEIIIEYTSGLDIFESGGMDAINAHHLWADPLMARIRAEWSPWSLRINFSERLMKHE